MWLSVISLSSIVIMSILWITHEFDRSRDESRRISEEYFDSLERAISVETDRIVDYLKAQTASSQVKFYLSIKTRVLEIHKMLEGFQSERGQGSFMTEETRGSLLSMLRHLSYDGGRGGYFCAEMDGTILIDGALNSEGPGGRQVAPSRFDQVALAKALESVAATGEGFYRLPLVETLPDGRVLTEEEVPVTFLKRFEGLGWVIGASERYSNFEKELGNELIRWIDNAPLPTEESLLVLDYEGKILSYRDPTLIGVNVFEGDRGTGLMTVAAQAIRRAKEASKGYLRFTLRPPSGSGGRSGVECDAYFRAVPGWRWVVINFVNISDLDEALEAQRQILSSNLRRTLNRIAATTVSTLIVILIISTFISRKAGASLEAFFRFFDKASTESAEISADEMPFQEFAHLAEAANSMIRQRREADRKLIDSELRFRTFFSVSPEMIAILNDNGEIVEANRELESFTGLASQEALGKSLYQALGAGEGEWAKLVSELGQKGQASGQELILERGAKKTFLLVFSKEMPLLEDKLILWEGVDITKTRLAELEKNELKEKLSRSKTMESIGRMAASVAHELNNILSALIGYPELLLEDPDLTPAQRHQVGEIMDAGHRASEVVGNLLTLSSGVATAKAEINLDELVKKVIRGPFVAKALAGALKKVTLETRLLSGAAIKGSQTHLKKVVANLVQNAIDALSGRGGRVEISSELMRLDNDPGFINNFSPGQYAHLTVSDDGPGIDPAILPHIFEPFFSQKSGSGHGLGLSLVELAVKEHGGGVSVSTSGSGTSFSVFFPAAKAAAKAAAPRRHDLKGSGQKILVVDDVDIQRKLAQKMLRTLGYSPHAVSSGEEAVVFLKENDVDLIILDMIMDPGINGRQTYEAILSFKPWQKAIIASGLAESDEVLKAQALGASQFVSKPYTLDDIAGAVHKALAAESAAGPPMAPGPEPEGSTSQI
jgi:PAS domain S-box-containing protein